MGFAVLTVDLGAIGANWRALRARLAAAQCGAVVKADAYGLGAARVAPALAAAGCRHFFVALLEEAALLRPALPADAALYVLNGLPPGQEAACAALPAIPVLNSLDQIDAWAALGRRKAALQVDTGMARLGLPPSEWQAAAAHLGSIEPVLLMSHLASAEHQASPTNEAQLARFRVARAVLPPMPASLANSSGIFLGADYHFDLARPGAALYGVAPVAGAANPMRPVLRLEAAVVQVRCIGAGDPVGYGGRWRAEAPARIATVGVGYADGLPRQSSNRGAAMLGGTRLPQVGTVSMDSVTFDATAVPDLRAGTMLELIGPACPLEAVAEAAGTIPYEILTRLGRRFERRYVD
jgi:alanine racemase